MTEDAPEHDTRIDDRGVQYRTKPRKIDTRNSTGPVSDGAKKKRKSSTSPTKRSLKLLRDRGAHLVAVVERWNPFGGAMRPDGSGSRTGIRVDLFGFIDVLAVMPDQVGMLGVQSCAASSITTRIRKVTDDPILYRRAVKFVAAQNRLVFQGWKKVAKTGRWICDEREFVLDKKPTTQPGENDEPNSFKKD